VINQSAEPVRVLIVSNFALPRAAFYSDSGKVRIRWSAEAEDALMFREQDGVEYWEGE
jgi:uncharacterized cupin superfamily protein